MEIKVDLKENCYLFLEAMKYKKYSITQAQCDRIMDVANLAFKCYTTNCYDRIALDDFDYPIELIYNQADDAISFYVVEFGFPERSEFITTLPVYRKVTPEIEDLQKSVTYT